MPRTADLSTALVSNAERKDGHKRAWTEIMQPGGERKSVYKGASQDLSSGLRLVAQMRRPRTCSKLNLLPGDRGRDCCKKFDHEGQLCARVTAAKRSSANNHARCGRSPKMPCSSLRRNAPARCHQYAEIRSGKPYNGTGYRQPETEAGHVHWGALGSAYAPL